MAEGQQRLQRQQAGARQSAAQAGAHAARRSATARLTAWARNHRVVAKDSLAALFAVWLPSVMTWLVIGIALALPTILLLLLTNIGDVSAEWEAKPHISIYLKSTMSGEDGRRFASGLESIDGIESVVYISPGEALAEFQALSGFGDVLDALDSNPLPAVVEVAPNFERPAELKLLVTRLSGMNEVESVSVDLAWVERLFAILALGKRFVAALAFFLALGVLLSIGNTIRLAIENRRAEIEVVKLVGGTDSFVRRPFLYLGFWYGLGGAVTAWLMVQVSLLLLSGPVDRLVRSYDDEFALVGLGPGATLILLATGALLGILGAGLAVGRHLHEIEPR